MGGGALGSLLRYLVSTASLKYFQGTFPMGTLLVNLMGSLLIGLLWALWAKELSPNNLRWFLIIGLLGGFTTFSAFSIETLNLFREGAYRIGLLNILANNLGGIILAFLGFALGKQILNWINIG